MTETKPCPNCGENLTGNFCANCGQKVKHINAPFKEVLSEAADSTFTFDSRFFRTLIPLVTKPGFLTGEYNLGRRARYVTPFKLYFFISFVLFFMLTIIDVEIITFTNTPKKQTELSSPAPDSLQVRPSKPPADSLGTVDKLQRKILQKLAQQEDNIKQINTAVVFALLLKLLYRRSAQFYLSHLIFSIHFHAFVFLVLIVRLLIYIVSDSKLSAVLLVLIPIYLFLSLKRVHSESLWMRLIKSFVLLLTYFLILAVSLTVLSIITILLF